jgi:hypothetical protein
MVSTRMKPRFVLLCLWLEPAIMLYIIVYLILFLGTAFAAVIGSIRNSTRPPAQLQADPWGAPKVRGISLLCRAMSWIVY